MPLTLRRLPLLKGKTFVYPERPVCPVCGRKRVFEPHPFATLAFGALLNTRHGAGLDERMDGFLNLVWHDGHSEVDHPRFACVTVPVADDVKGGQGEFYFCSTPCLRRFFNGLVDELDRRVKGERVRLTPKRPSRASKPARRRSR
jgi:hypothetical protein